jgi:TldD protein
MAEKISLMEGYECLARSLDKVTGTRLRYADIYKIKAFLNSAGTRFEYDFNQGGFVLSYTLKDGNAIFDDSFRAYASKFGELKSHQEKIEAQVKESRRFLSAPAIPPGKYRVLLDPEVTGVFTHESFGHKSEADFMLGNADALSEWSIGKKIGADCLTIVDSGNNPCTSGYCPIDDEGTPAQKNYLIKNGVLAGRLHSRETALQLQEKPTGNARAINFEFEPLVRMTSTYIEAGKESFESILSRSDGAILVQGVKHGSGLSTFTIAPTRGYKILPGGALEPIRLTVISGSVFETLKNIEAVSSEFHLHSSALGGCGKMDQWPLPVADGGPYVLVKEMQVS